MSSIRNTQPPCPECDKLTVVSEKSNAIGEFLDWMIERTDYRVCDFIGDKFCDGEYSPSSHLEREKLLAKYFEIDLDKVEDEGRALLDWIRQEHRT